MSRHVVSATGAAAGVTGAGQRMGTVIVGGVAVAGWGGAVGVAVSLSSPQ